MAEIDGISVGNYPVFLGEKGRQFEDIPRKKIGPEELQVKRTWESWESVRGLSLSIRQTLYVGKADHHLPNHQPGVSWRSRCFQPFHKVRVN